MTKVNDNKRRLE